MTHEVSQRIRRPVGVRLPRVLCKLGVASLLCVTGCAALAAAVAASILTGLFLGPLQASLQATAHSYEYDDRGDVQFGFHNPQPASPTLSLFSGRLPGFHIVFLSLAGKGNVAAQAVQAMEFETDADIDFSTDPPTIGGMVRQKDNGQETPLRELYPELSLEAPRLTGPDADGRVTLTLAMTGRAASGEALDYSLAFAARLSDDGNDLQGSATIRRALTADGGEPDVVEGTANLSLEKISSALPR